MGERLGKYEVEKRRALEGEDFDLAQQKKQQMEEYRAHIQQQLEYHSLLDYESQGVSLYRCLTNCMILLTKRREFWSRIIWARFVAHSCGKLFLSILV